MVESEVEALRRGDREALDAFIRAHYERVRGVVARLLRDDALVEDVVQDAFIMAMRGLPGFEGQAKLTTWLHRVAVNAALMELRKRKPEPVTDIEPLLPRFDETGHHFERPRPWASSPAELAQRAEVRELVRGCIDALPADHRSVLLLRDVEGYDTREAAQALGITAGAVKTRLHRARQALRTLIDSRFREAL